MGLAQRNPVSTMRREQQHQEEEEARLLDRLDRKLCHVYGVGAQGRFDWKTWDFEIAASLTARVMVQHPDLWEPFVVEAKVLTSRLASRMLGLMVTELAARSRLDRIVGLGWEDLLHKHLGGSPRFERLARSPHVADWIVARSVAGERKTGADPGRLVWRRVCIALTVREIDQVSFRPATSDDVEPSCCTLVAEHLVLSKSTVYQGSWAPFRKMERARGEILQPDW